MSAISLPKSLYDADALPVPWRSSINIRNSRKAPAESAAGKVSFDLWNRIQREKIKTITDPPENVRLERELADILQECSIPNWDGYGAKSIDRTSVQYVCQFLEQLPAAEISYPELSAEPNGDLTMVWRNNGYHLVIGIDNARQIAWGGASPKGHVYGDVKFDAGIPEELIDLLRSVARSR